MSRSTDHLPLSRRNRESSSALWIGWAVYGGIAFLGFCFGVWAGNQRPKSLEVVKQNPPDQVNAKPDSNVPDPKTGTNPPAPKGTNTPPQNKYVPPEPKKTDPMPMTNVEPKKMDPMSEPKKVEPKKVEPMPSLVATNLTFEKDIKKILVTNCQGCHGDNNKTKGDFDVRTLAAIMKGGESNAPGLTPGDPTKSSLLTEIENGNMPPAGSGKIITAMDKKLIKEWITGGAK